MDYLSRPHPRLLLALIVIAALLLLGFVAASTSAASLQKAAKPVATTTTTTTGNDVRVTQLETQLQECNGAWRHIATRESDALMTYNDAAQSIVTAIQQGDQSALDDAASGINAASAIIDEIAPKVTEADATCTP